MVTIQRLPQVMRETGLSKSTIYSYIENGLWPAPIKLGARASGWIGEENAAVIQARIAGNNDSDIRNLVHRLHAKRKEAA